jgi:hypothetical protein
LPPWFQGSTTPFVEREAGVADQQLAVDRHLGAEPGALRAGAEGALNENVRGSISVSAIGWPFGQLSFSLKVRKAASPVEVDEVDHHQAVGQPERGLDRIGETGEQIVGCHQPIHHDGDVVLDLLLEHGRLGELDQLTVDEGRE